MDALYDLIHHIKREMIQEKKIIFLSLDIEGTMLGFRISGLILRGSKSYCELRQNIQ